MPWSFLVAPIGTGAVLLAMFAYSWHNIVARRLREGVVWPARWW